MAKRAEPVASQKVSGPGPLCFYMFSQSLCITYHTSSSERQGYQKLNHTRLAETCLALQGHKLQKTVNLVRQGDKSCNTRCGGYRAFSHNTCLTIYLLKNTQNKHLTRQSF